MAAFKRLKAAYLARMEVLDRRGAMAAEHGSTAAWLRSELHRAPAAASRDVHLSRDLADVLPCVAAEQAAFEARRLHASSTVFGTGVGNWICDPVSQEVIVTAIHAASRPQAGDSRSPAQRRLDGLVAVCEIALRSAELPETGGVKPHVTVVIDFATLLGLPGATAARLGFGTAISGAEARQIACDAEISRIITGPNGEVPDSGRSTRTFTAAQRHAIVARDRHCRWRGCDRPAAWCDAHHRIEWVAGGSTSVDNGALLCGRHHRRLHRDDLAVVIGPDGTRTVDVVPGSGRRIRDPAQRAGP
jgi:Domain of unknown function (DUF222)